MAVVRRVLRVLLVATSASLTIPCGCSAKLTSHEAEAQKAFRAKFPNEREIVTNLMAVKPTSP